MATRANNYQGVITVLYDVFFIPSDHSEDQPCERRTYTIRRVVEKIEGH